MVAKKLWAIIVVGLLLVGIAGICYGEDKQAPQGVPGAPPFEQGKMNDEFGKALDELIAVRVISVQQKNIIIAYFEKAFKDAKPMDPQAMGDLKRQDNDPLSLLVKDGVINRDQAAVIARVLPRPMPMGRGYGPDHPQTPADPEKMKATLQKKLDELVGSKVITDKQEDTIQKYFTDAFEKMKDKKPCAELGRGKDMKGVRKDPLSLLVKDGVITQEQADVIGRALFQHPAPMDNPELHSLNF